MTYMKGDNNMPTVLPKENEVEQFFSRIMASKGACERLSSVLYDHLSDDDMQTDPDPKHLVQVLLTAYTNGDISALLLELCGRSLFDLLREAYLIPKRFHGKAGSAECGRKESLAGIGQRGIPGIRCVLPIWG